VESAAFLLEGAWRYFPEGSVHVAVVDPGVGTQRRRSEVRYFVEPDNGALSAALPEQARGAPGEEYEARIVSLPDGVEAVAIENEDRFGNLIRATSRETMAPLGRHPYR
jgi:hypothetical protein